jgi:acyl-CoA synthetase (AMP-forming)/AMP-acid ligase II
MTLGDVLERSSASDDTGLRFVDRGEQVTWLSWRDIHRRALVACGRMQAGGLRPGDRIALVFPTAPEFFDAFFGTLLAGAVPVPLYPPVRLGRLEEYAARTAAMLTAAGVRIVLAQPRVRRLLGTAVAPAVPELGCCSLDDLPPGPPTPAGSSPDDLALIQFSSGTTVDPKPVALSHRALLAQTERLNGFWPQPAGSPVDSGVSWLPLYHDMGLVGCVLPALVNPGTLTLIPPEVFVARPAVWLRTISRFGATISPAPNFAYGLCVDKIRDDELEGVDLSSWRVALNGAEPVAPRVLRRFIDRFSHWGFRREALTPVYGLSEAALAVTFSDVDRPFTSLRFDRDALSADRRAVPAADGVELVSVGRPLPDFELRLVDEARRPVNEDRVGRVLVRGPSLMQGYFGRPEDTEAVLRDGWLDTGDLGFLHAGELYLTGRAKEVLILNGRNHAPNEVEHAVDRVDGVRTGCAVAASWRPDDGDRELLAVLVEAARDVPANRWPAIARECAAEVRAATGLATDRVEVLAAGTLPRTSSGKLRRREALRRWLAGELTPPDVVGLLQIAGAMVRSSLAFASMERNRGDAG